MSRLKVIPCLDNDEIAAARKHELNISSGVAAALGRSAVDAALQGRYLTEEGREVVWKDAVQGAILARRSIPPNSASLQFRVLARRRLSSRWQTKPHWAQADVWLIADYVLWL